jgi:xanthine dehydrogenase accessory factor
MQRDTLSQLISFRRDRRAVILVTDLDAGTERLVAEGEPVDDGLGEAVDAAFRTGKSSKVIVGDRTLFLNAHLPPVKIIVIGAVRISQVLATMAALAGFDLSIIDPRGASAVAGPFDDARLIAGWPRDTLVVDPHTAVVAVSHDPHIDDFPIAAGLRAGCFYVGALGSRKSHAARLERLRAEGLGEAELCRVHAPVGLDIGAVTPAEIAVAILAEIIQALRCRERPVAVAAGEALKD